MSNQPRRGDDTGATLIIALVIITTVALVTGAMLAHAYTNVAATVSLRGVVGTSYAGDAAAKEAINNLRLGARAPEWSTPPSTFPGPWTNWVYTNNTDGTGCFGIRPDGQPDNSLELNNGFYPKTGDQTADTTARVECSVVPGTGIFGAGAGVGVNDPQPTDAFARALTTVGTTGTRQGINVKPLGVVGGNVQPMPMRGGVASRSTINADNGPLLTDGYVWANGNCTGTIVTPDEECNSPGKVAVPPAPPSPLDAVPAFEDATNEGCTFQPGFYNDAAALTSSVNACPTARFASGKYYFDFTDANHSASDTNVWTIGTTLIGGDLGGSPTIPGRCRTPIGHDPNDGVQFVFGGTSRIALSDTAHVELCGPANGGNPPTTIYQQQTGSPAPVVAMAAVAGQDASNGSGSKVRNFTTVPSGATLTDALSAVGGPYAKWIATNKNDVAALNVRKFPGLPSVPAGSDIESAQVRVNYAKTSTANLTVAATDGVHSGAAITVGAPDSAGWGTADVSDEVRGLIEHAPFSANSPQLELRMVAADKTDTLNIDAVTLTVTYRPPSLEAAPDVADGPDCSNGAPVGCIISAPGGNFKGQFVVQGATYVPNGYVALVPGSSSPGVFPLVSFCWGLVARGVDFKSQPSQTFGYPLVWMPDAGHGVGSRTTIVDLEVFVCPEQGSCDSGGTHTLTARVQITDPPYDTDKLSAYYGIPEPGRRQIKVLSWSEQN